MKVFLLCILTILVGCTDATIDSLSAYGESAKIYCYSGGEKVFEDQSTGKIEMLDGGGGWHYRSVSGRYVRTFADCFVEVEL